MNTNRRFRPSYATVVAYDALFVALGGTTYAAANIPAGSIGTQKLRNGAVTHAKLHANAVTAINVVDNSLTGAQINASTLGTVPNAAHATDADNLGGSPASDYRLHCPSNLAQAADLCFDVAVRPYATLYTAMTTCAGLHMRLPTPSDLELIFQYLGANQSYEWTSDVFFPPNQPAVGVVVRDDFARQPIFNADFATNAFDQYRCITSAGN